MIAAQTTAATTTGSQNPSLDVLWWNRYPPTITPGNPPTRATSHKVLLLILLILPAARSFSRPIAPNPNRLASPIQLTGTQASNAEDLRTLSGSAL